MSHPDFATTPLRPAPDIVHRRIAGEQILVPVRRGAAEMDYLFTANEVGSLIYKLLDGRRCASEIAGLVSREFEVEEDRALSDVVQFLQDLYGAKLVEPTPEGER